MSYSSAIKVPHAIEVEKAVLGAIMVDLRAWDLSFPYLRGNSDAFYDEVNKAIFEAMIRIKESGGVIDLITVSEELSGSNAISSYGGNSYLVELSQKVSTSAHTPDHARILKDKYVCREIYKMSSDAISKSAEEGVKAEELFTDIMAESNRLQYLLSESLDDQESSSLGQAILEQMNRLLDGGTVGTTWGWSELDIKIGGPLPGDNWYIGGRPGMAKSAIMLQKAKAEARRIVQEGRDEQVIVYSMEMSKEQVYKRLVVSDKKFSMNNLFYKDEGMRGRIDSLLSAIEGIEALPIVVVTDIKDFVSIMADLSARHVKKKVALAMFDYLQLMSHGGRRFATEEAEVGAIAKEQKQWAKKMNIPFVTLSQLSRAVESRNVKRPTLSDLRASGQIEEAADWVGFLYRPSYYDDQDNSPDEMIVAKYRNGMVGTVQGRFDGSHQTWGPETFGYQHAPVVPEYVRDPSGPESDTNDTPF